MGMVSCSFRSQGLPECKPWRERQPRPSHYCTRVIPNAYLKLRMRIFTDRAFTKITTLCYTFMNLTLTFVKLNPLCFE